MVAAANVGPKPIPYKSLTADGLAAAIQFCLSEDVVTAAEKISGKLRTSSGVMNAVRSFHAQLPLEQLRCDILRGEPAVWIYKSKNLELRLSGVAAEILEQHVRLIERSSSCEFLPTLVVCMMHY